MTLGTWCLAALLGGAGALVRFLLDAAVSSRVDRDFPYGTLLVNLSGAALLGLTVGLALRGNAALLTGSATIGAYTTFSTWMLESQRLVEEGAVARGAANAILSLGLGLLAAALGRTLGAHL
jgi:CrcB protein